MALFYVICGLGSPTQPETLATPMGTILSICKLKSLEKCNFVPRPLASDQSYSFLSQNKFLKYSFLSQNKFLKYSLEYFQNKLAFSRRVLLIISTTEL